MLVSFLKDNHLGWKTQTEYDLSERPCQSTIRDAQNDELIYRTSLEYDKMNRLTAFREQTAHDSHETSFSYDKDNRPTAIQYDDANHKVEYTYDGLGRIEARKVTNGASEYNTSYEFVAGDTEKYGAGATTPLVKKITQPGMNFEYEYDSRGNIISETRNGLVTRYEYDALGQLIYVSDPHENAVWFYTYDLGGNILAKRKYTRNADGASGDLVEETSFQYNNADWKDQLTGYCVKKYENSQVVEQTTYPFTYDAIGNPLTDGERTYEWEAGRRLKKITMKEDPANGIIDGVDESSGSVLKIVFSNGNLLANGVNSTVASARVIRYNEDVTAEYPASEFSWHRHSGNATADAAWDAAHTGMKEVTFTAADLSENTRFTCDLTHSIGAFGSVSVDNTFKVSVTRDVADANDTLILENGNLSVTTEENIYELQDNSLIASSSLLNGTLTATSWVYNSEPEKIVEFKYNAAGLRVQKDVTINGITETTKYILRGKQIAEMVCGEDRLHFFYDEKNVPTYVNLNGTYYSYAHNELGDIIGIYDNSGLIIVYYKYDAWGNSFDITDTSNKYLGINNPLRYNGYIWDPDVQLYYLENRFYNSKISRFISSDYIHLPAYSDKNRNIFLNSYAYCKNNPKSSSISKIDLSKNNYWYRGPYRHKFIALSY